MAAAYLRSCAGGLCGTQKWSTHHFGFLLWKRPQDVPWKCGYALHCRAHNFWRGCAEVSCLEWHMLLDFLRNNFLGMTSLATCCDSNFFIWLIFFKEFQHEGCLWLYKILQVWDGPNSKVKETSHHLLHAWFTSKLSILSQTFGLCSPVDVSNNPRMGITFWLWELIGV